MLCAVVDESGQWFGEIQAYSRVLRRALDRLAHGDSDGYTALITAKIAAANAERWQQLGAARLRATRRVKTGAHPGHPILDVRTKAPGQLQVSASIPRSVKEAVLARDGQRCAFCSMPLVMPADWERLRRSKPCLLPGAVLRNGIARRPDGRALGMAERAPIIGYRHQFEHLVPRARGGTNTADNVVSACGWCNRAKRTHTLDELGLPTPQLG